MKIFDQRIEIRMDKDMRRYLLDLEQDASKYIRTLVDKDRLEKRDPEFIKQKRMELKQELEKLDELEKSKIVNEDKIRELLAYHAPAFKQNAQVRTEGQRIRFLENSIMKDLKKLGSKNTPEEIDKILLNWPD
jgi:DNA integrity scanning protein DisA with diadenylate cyclase activity